MDERVLEPLAKTDTPLAAAARSSNSWAARALIEAGASCSATGSSSSPLRYAIANGDSELVRALLDCGASLDERDAHGRTAARLAGRRPHMFSWLGLESETGVSSERAHVGALDAAASSSGGWWSAPTAMKWPSTCDIAVVAATQLDAATLVLDYVLASRPVLVRGSFHSLHRANELRELWSRRSWLATFGDATMTDIGAIPYADQYGQSTERMSGTDFARLHMGRTTSVAEGGGGVLPPYHFVVSEATLSRPSDGRSVRFGVYPPFVRGLTAAAACRHLWRNPLGQTASGTDSASREREAACWARALAEGNATSLPDDSWIQTYIGGDRSGSPWHFHSTALNWLVYGRKRWQLRPPASRLYAVRRDQLPAGDARAPVAAAQCVQEAGDAMFVPRQWAHAVDNEGDVLGFALEIGEPDDDLELILAEHASTTLRTEGAMHDEL